MEEQGMTYASIIFLLLRSPAAFGIGRLLRRIFGASFEQRFSPSTRRSMFIATAGISMVLGANVTHPTLPLYLTPFPVCIPLLCLAYGFFRKEYKEGRTGKTEHTDTP